MSDNWTEKNEHPLPGSFLPENSKRIDLKKNYLFSIYFKYKKEIAVLSEKRWLYRFPKNH